MRKRIITFVLMSLFLMANLSSTFAITFSDLDSNHWAYQEITALTEAGIINGYENGTYQPERAVSRGEFLKLIMVALYEGNEYFETNNFHIGHWATPYAIEAAESGYLMSGTSVDRLNDNISRLEMVHILAKICIDNRIQKAESSEAISFQDTTELEEESKLYIDFVTSNGLINGYTDGTFKPNKTMTRAEVATVMSRFLKLKNEA